MPPKPAISPSVPPTKKKKKTKKTNNEIFLLVDEEEKEEEEEDDDDDDENDGNINEEFVRINGTINVEAITKIWIVRRAGTYGMSGKFTCVDPPMISIDDF